MARITAVPPALPPACRYFSNPTNTVASSTVFRSDTTAFAGKLSSGQKTRVSLAKSLINEPEILLLDEPFGALDQQTRLLMGDEMLRLWRETGATIFLITHALDEAAMLRRTTIDGVAYLDGVPVSGAMTLVTHGVALGCQAATVRPMFQPPKITAASAR